tara:strand:+ start:3673 stop:4596 length:924 start_codon:yes stop_codon:yes gene_type:complete
MGKYSLKDYDNIAENCQINELSITTIKIVNDLAKKVGAPNYSKTPIFKKKPKHQKYHINKEDWEQIRNFKTTQLKKTQDGIEAQLDLLRINLNKLTNKNYEVITNEIFNFINNIIDKEKDGEKTYKTLMLIGDNIFEIGCLNVFWSDLYATLFRDLIGQFEIMEKICHENLNKFIKIFDTIECVQLSNNNYNEFCDCNKKNENRRGMSGFFINLMMKGIVQKEYIYTILKNLLDNINSHSSDEFTNINEEIIENISIILIKGKEFLTGTKEWEGIIRTIEFYSENNDTGISKKIQFKCLDIIDELDE